ncbi:hypothetical protein QL285_057284 [Trifolium repens]|nr:hypothetical protein QL285_057284 [Trifolium repens]
MAPKAKQTQGSKRKGVESSQPRRPTRPAQFDGNRFRSAAHYERFKELSPRKLWHDKEFKISPMGEYKGILDIFEKRKWGRLLAPYTQINSDIVKEFFVNAFPVDEDGDPSEKHFDYTTFVRGRQFSFDREAINTYLGNPFPIRHPDDLCTFHRKQAQGNWDHDLLQRTILKEGRTYDVSAAGRPHRALKGDMTTPAQVILKLIVHNIRPESHTSSTTVDVTPLICSILDGTKVDVARIIATELRHIALSGKFTPSCPLGLPGLIMGLVSSIRIPIPPQVHETIANPIDDVFIARNMDKKTKQRPQTSRPSSSRAPRVPQASQPLDFSNFDPRLQACYSYTWDQNDASYRAMSALQNSMYRMQMHSGMPDDAALQVMSPEAYQMHVAWPGVRPFHYGGGSAQGDGAGQGDGDGNDDGVEGDGEDDDEVFSANASGEEEEMDQDDE